MASPSRLLSLLACLLAFSPAACGRREAVSGDASDRPGRVVMVGVDGADWRVIEPLVARGRMPAFKRLMEQGATGTLRSMLPSASPSLWTTIATGVGPDRHGIHGFVVEGQRGADDAGRGEEGRATPADGGAGVRPVTSAMRRAPA